MKCVIFALVALFIWSGAGTAFDGIPFEEETLRYTVNWPSGLSLGEVQLRSEKAKSTDAAAEQWKFNMTLDAAVPGFEVKDHYSSAATPDLCSSEFEKDIRHGKKSTRERTTFDPDARTATRETLDGGGKSELSIPACAKDALTFLYHVRRELNRGRIPPPQTIFFGAPYEVRFDYGGRKPLRLSQETIEADRMVVSVKGKASDVKFEIFFAVEDARRPVIVRVPLPLGTFSMELVQ
jgi:hypothetical protein